MSESSLPYHLPPFDKIKDEQFVPAIEAGMRRNLKEAEEIANQTEKPTFENTIVAMEQTGRLLDRAEPHLFQPHRRRHQPDSAKDREGNGAEICRASGRDLSERETLCPCSSALQPARQTRAGSGIGMSARALLQGFRSRGSEAIRADKTKLKAMNAELATLQTTFEQNVLKEKNAVVGCRG